MKMEETPLGRLKRATGHKAPSSAARRERERREWLATTRFPYADGVSVWGPTDAEIESILLKNPKLLPAIERGTVCREDLSEQYTVQTLGYRLVANGWSIVPQDREGQRKPARFILPASGKRAESSYAFLPTKYREARIGLREFLHLEHLRDANLAIQCCAASGHIRVIDIDCRTPEVAEMVMKLAIEHLGLTPFIRYGAKPKVILIYRVDPKVEADVKAQKSASVLLNADGTPDVDANGRPMNVIEYLSTGSIFTAFGLHHKTGLNFDWSQGTETPLTAGPEKAPLITPEKMRKFFNAVHAFRPIKPTTSPSNPYGSTKSVALEFDSAESLRGRVWTPRRIHGDWLINEDGKVTDGAINWLTAQTWAICAANAHMLRSAYSDLEGWLQFEARRRLLGIHRDNPALQTEGQVEREVSRGLRSTADKWLNSLAHHARTGAYEGGIIPWTIGEDGRKPNAQRIVGAPRPADGSLDWIPDESCPVEQFAEHQPQAKTAIVEKSIEQIEADRAARALIETKEERKAESNQVKSETRGIIRDWLWTEVSPRLLPVTRDISLSEAMARNLPSKPWVLLGPTGAGKTVGSIGELGPFCRAHPRKDNEGPILLVLATHANGDEAMSVAMREGMFNADLWSEEDIEDLTEDLGGQGVKIERFKGLDNFCHRKDERRALTSRGIGASGLCQAEVPKDPEFLVKKIRRENRGLNRRDRQKIEMKTVLCPFKEDGSCKYFAQLAKIKTADIVIVSHAYLTMARLPKELQNPRAVVIDESTTYQLLKRYRMPLSVLSSTRKESYVSETDREMWPTWSDEDISAHYTQQRNALCELVSGWLAQGLDISNELSKLPNGKELLTDTQKLLTRALERAREVRPDLTPKQVQDIALLLDASAKPRIIEKVFGSEPVVRKVEARMRVRTVPMIERTWSNSTFLPPEVGATDDQLKAAAEAIEQARRLITTTAMVFGHGRVLVGTTVKVRAVITAMGWTPPPTVDFVHFGDLRGRDFAKGHVAAISIGRSEQPIGVVDDLTAALTYDDEVPEEPFDKLGTGMTAEGKVLFRPKSWQRLLMRTGQDVDNLISRMPSKPVLDDKGKPMMRQGTPVTTTSWAQLLEEAWREEELSQFVGRLRPVHRSIDDDLPPPVWIAVGKILPPGIIIDELIEMGSVLKLWPMAEIARLSGGVIADNIRVPGTESLYRGRTTTELGADLPKGLKMKLRVFAPFAHVRYRLDGDGYGRMRSAMLLPDWVPGDAMAHWDALSERYGRLPDVISVTPPKLVGPTATPKPQDTRDVDRDDALIAELEVRAARAEQPLAAEHGMVEFELRRAREMYVETEEEDSALSDAPEPERLPACVSSSTSPPKTSTPKFVASSMGPLGLRLPPG